ncbi:proline-rich protein 15 [Sceloporus undulatus]|uniref:proline-rich protein 15 n=1 Tax=Sceloporus undulatus TaxID=8520 RepID=UPI001C4BAA2C|nr:proline-rich protein 15 [Sceloporus undulatus]XP_042327452.1 proline-rich protein 15 [Sceloporus undulatus]
MAESASTAAPPSGGPGAKGSGGGSSGAWWKVLTSSSSSSSSRKKPKEPPVAAPGAIPAPPSPSDSRENQQPGSGSRRNLKISRSGRFKEKRKVRATLLAESPQKLFEGGGGSTSTTPVLPGEETRCQ